MGILCKVEDYIADIVIDRPEAFNALNPAITKELGETAAKLAARSDVRAAIIRGGGDKSFVAGADIVSMMEMSAQEAAEFCYSVQSVFLTIERLPFPTIAAIQGFALGGGCELALSCDIRIASTRGRFGLPEVGLGIIPGGGGTQRLARLIGLGQAKRLIFSTEQIKAEEALAIGLIEKMTAPEDLMPTALKMAADISAKGPHAVQSAKIAIDQGYGVNIEAGLSIEAGLCALCFGGGEQREGMKAFTEKRVPQY
ncbi:MAG: enoyl-CoA hydratase/isomerase family protein [Gracilibacteraceae bacterium]|jgi:enoyl-CoA hydratase|nr:enoyl-CoA hydratase/isomerase family protein [Gracilibacteraceae bacterium]